MTTSPATATSTDEKDAPDARGAALVTGASRGIGRAIDAPEEGDLSRSPPT